MAEMDDDGDLHDVRDEDDDSEQEAEGDFEWDAQEDVRDFDWVEEEEVVLDTDTSKSFHLDTPAERSGHIAVVDRNCMYVWGGYKVSKAGVFADNT